jgi:hypothetical protein
MNRKISIKSIIATISFLALSVILGFSIHFHGWKADTPVFWFLAVLLLGTLLSVIVCIANIDKRINLYTKITEEADPKKIKLTTCPDYWTKHTAMHPETNRPVTMCFNMYGDKFIDGELTTNYTFGPNSVFSGSNIEDLRNEQKLSHSAGIESFTQLNNEQGLNMNDEYKYRHLHYTKLIASDSDGNAEIPSHNHEYDVGMRWHSHGPSWDDSGLGFGNKFVYAETDKNFDNWINPFVDNTVTKGKVALEINLNQMNSSENVCTLAKKFPWTEATIKCKEIKDMK